MKVIDLLNKIANNKNYKPTFLFRGSMYKYNAETKYYEPSFISLYKIYMILNDEVEIIEDKPKKIEKIEMNGNEFYSEYVETWIEKSKYDAYAEYLSNKINEVIEKLNYLLEKSDKE